MYTLTKYFNDSKLLASSIVIKHNDIALAINRGLAKNYGITSSNDYTTWKYYLNLSGVSHSTNNVVMVPVVETSTSQPLTTSLLDANPRTRELLDSRTDLYKNLISSFPNDIDYINGCISPVDINKAINAPDGTILSWSKQYIEPQEYSLIKELNKEIRLFFKRWYIRDYNIPDELYLSSVLGVLWSTLPNTIILNRIRDSRTAEVHSFHLEHFFRSHLDIWKEVSMLQPNTIRWLYSNLITLINNTGTNYNLNTIIDKIFTSDNVGIGGYILNDGVVKEISTGITNPTYSRTDPTLTPIALNTLYDIRNTTSNVIDVITKELLHTTINGKVANLTPITATDIELNNISKNVTRTQLTKVIDFGNIELFKFYNTGLIETVLDNWLYLANLGVYTTPQTFNDPNTGVSHKLTPLTGVILFYRLLQYKLHGTDPVFKNIKYNTIIKNNLTVSSLTSNNLLKATGLSSVISEIVSKIPTTPTIVRTPSDFSTEVDKIISMFEHVWVLDSNVNNSFLSANIKTIVNSIYIDGSVNIFGPNGSKLSSYLSSVGINISLTPTYDVAAAHAELFKVFTNFNIDETFLVKELYSNYEMLFEKLSSYTIQTISPDISNGNMDSTYTSMSVINTPTGYIEVKSGKIIRVLETNNSTITGVGNDFIEYCIPNNIPTVNMLDIDSKNHIQLKSNLSYGNYRYNQNTKPDTYTEIKKASYIPYYPSNTLETNNMTPPAPVVINGGIGGNVSSSRNNIGGSITGNVTNYNNATKPASYSEILLGGYNTYTPVNVSYSNTTGNATPVIKTTPTPNVTAAVTDPTILSSGVNASVTTGPTVNVQIPGSKPVK